MQESKRDTDVTEQSFGLCGRGRGWDDSGEWHWNMYNIIYETSCQFRFDAWYWMLGAGALGWPRGMVWGERREEGSGWGTHVYLWRIHFDIWQNQYNILKLKNKIFFKKGKLGIKLQYDLAISTTEHIPWGSQNWKRHMYPNIHCSTIYNSQDMKAT